MTTSCFFALLLSFNTLEKYSDLKKYCLIAFSETEHSQRSVENLSFSQELPQGVELDRSSGSQNQSPTPHNISSR